MQGFTQINRQKNRNDVRIQFEGFAKSDSFVNGGGEGARTPAV